MVAPVTDFSIESDVTNLSRVAIETFGRIDVWINNVGVGAIGYFWDIPVDIYARVVDVNLKGLIYGAHAALQQFLMQDGGTHEQDGGTLVDVGSIGNEVPLGLQNT